MGVQEYSDTSELLRYHEIGTPQTAENGEQTLPIVAYTTREIKTTVIYHRRLVDQFFGFSISFWEKSSCPCSLRCGVSPFSIARERYGFAVGLDISRSRRSIALLYGSTERDMVTEVHPTMERNV